MFNPFKKLFKQTIPSVLGVDIGESSIKVVQLGKKDGRAVLETYGALALGPYGNVEIGRATNLSTEKIVEALNDLLREAKVTASLAAVAIPFKASLMSVIEVPKLPERELDQMVPLEARKHIPVPISEVALDWSIIPKDVQSPITTEAVEPDKKNISLAKREVTDILLVAIHNDVLNRYQQISDGASLQTSFFEIEIFSTMRSVIDKDPSPIMILDFGAASTKVYIVERGIIRNSHTINKGSQDITLTISKSLGVTVSRAEIIKRSQGVEGSINGIKLAQIIDFTLDFILAEANRVLLNYQKRYNKNVSKVYLVGGGSALKGFEPVASERFRTDVFVADPFSRTETPAFLEGALKEAGPEFAVAIGTALRQLQEAGN